MSRAPVTVKIAASLGLIGLLLACALFATGRWRGGRDARHADQLSESARAEASTTSASLGRDTRGAASADTGATVSTKDWFVDRAGAPIALSGRVFTGGRAVSGIVVTAVDELTTDGALPPQSAVTDGEGRFVFAAMPRIRGWYRLATSRGGAAPAWAMVPGDMPKNDIELRLETCKIHIYGLVADASGGAVPAAKVFLEKVPEHSAVSDQTGRFELCAPARPLRLSVEAQGYAPWMRWVSPRGALRQDVTLVPSASIAGTVVLVRGGAPVPHALVSLRAFGESVRDVQADEEGHFEIAGVAPGSYAVEARSRGAKSKHPVDVSAFASAKANVTVPIDTRARVHGRLMSVDGPVARNGMNLGFSATFEWGTSVRTGDDGTFTIDDAPIGNVFVKVDDFEVVAPKTLLVPDDGLADVIVNVAAKAQLLVSVTRHGEPVSDATVFLRGVVGSDTKSTNAAGVATFKGLGESSYRIVTEHESDFAVMERVQVARDSHEPTKVSLELTTGRQVSGRVVDDQGRAVDGARVSFTSASSTEDSGASAITGADGSFRGGPLHGPAVYQPKVVRSGFSLDPKTELPRLTVPESGAATPAELVLVVRSQDKDLAGRVVDSANGPIRDARVTVSRPERHADILATTFTGNDGTFALHGLGAGPWAVKASAASGSEAKLEPVTLPKSDLRIELPPVGAIHGRVSGFARTPSVMAWSVVGYDWDFHPAVVESGRFTIVGLSRGRYHVAASSTDGAAQTTVDVDGNNVVEIELASSGKRTIHGKTLDFASGRPLPNMSCQAAPYIEGARSPVVVPGNIFSNDEGDFQLVDVPASDLYMWCVSDATSFRGGVARMPSDLGDKTITVWGLDVRGKPPLDVRALGMTLADDFPFSRRVAVVEPKGAAERAGIRVGDVFESVGERSVAEVGNGIVRNYLALLLTSQKRVAITTTRNGAIVPLAFKLD